MTRRLLGRLIQSAVVLLVLSFLGYALIGLMPGDPIDLMVAMDPDVSAEDVARIKALHGLDRPLPERWLDWLGGALSGDLGTSRLYGGAVTDVMAAPLLNTLILIGLAIGVAFLVAVPLGVAAALKPRSAIDYLVNLIAFAGVSAPVFWVGLLLIALFSVTLGWLPASGTGGPAHLVLPVLTLSVTAIGQYSRYVRQAMIEVLREDWVRTARAKGLPRGHIVLRQALRAAMIPVTTVLALDFGMLFSGALVTETVFAYPGMGKLIFDATMGNDYNLALAGLLLATLTTLIGNALADLSYGLLDPRTRRP